MPEWETKRKSAESDLPRATWTQVLLVLLFVAVLMGAALASSAVVRDSVRAFLSTLK